MNLYFKLHCNYPDYVIPTYFVFLCSPFRVLDPTVRMRLLVKLRNPSLFCLRDLKKLNWAYGNNKFRRLVYIYTYVGTLCNEIMKLFRNFFLWYYSRNEFMALDMKYKSVNLGQGKPNFSPPDYILQTLTDVTNSNDTALQQYSDIRVSFNGFINVIRDLKIHRRYVL